MPLYIRDETANALVLTIDNNGNMAFADGTPIDRLTLGGYGIIDSEGYIVHGLDSNSVTSAAGSLSLGYGQNASITTIPGRMPTVQLDTVAPARSYFVTGGTPHNTPINSPLHVASPDYGSFEIFNMNQADEETMESPVFSKGPNLSADVTYRWL
jgi:hypothetical protein